MPSKALPMFPQAAKAALENPQLRHNLGNATAAIRAKREASVGELPDWEALRDAGSAIKARVMRHLDEYLLQLEAAVQHAGGQVHWARDAAEANRIVTEIVQGTIILDGGARQGRRVLSLVPDRHLCVVYAQQVVGLVPEGIARMEERKTRPITLISGPSATSDIELSRVEGVHGPRTLHVLVVRDPIGELSTASS